MRKFQKIKNILQSNICTTLVKELMPLRILINQKNESIHFKIVFEVKVLSIEKFRIQILNCMMSLFRSIVLSQTHLRKAG